MKCAIYGRYSTDMQSETSIDGQFRNCDQRVEREGWEVVARYADEAISGTISKRPQYQQMLSDAKAKKFDILLIDDLSRLSRDSVESKLALRRLKFWGVRVIAVSDGFDSGQKGHSLTADFKGVMNQQYIESVAAWTHRGQTEAALKGNSCGGKSYGYRNLPIEDPIKKDNYGRPLIIGARKEINPEEARWVVQIYEWYSDGLSPRKIAAELNRLGVLAPRAPRSSSWSMSTIYGDRKRTGIGILNNPLYIGKYAWNRSRWERDPDTGKYKRFERPESEWVIKDMPELRIISDELWNKVQTRRKEQSLERKTELGLKVQTGRGPKYILSSLLKCTCGGNYIIIDTHRYGCARHKDRGPAVCSNDLKIDRVLLESKLLEAIKTDLFTDEAMEIFLKETQRLLTERQREKVSSKDDLRKRLQQVAVEITNLLTAIKAGILTSSTRSEMEKLESEKQELERKMAYNPELDKVTTFLPRAKASYKKLVNELEHTLLTDTLRARALLRKLLGGKVRLVPEDGNLVAEIRGDYAGLLSITAPKLNAGSGDRI